MQVFEPDEVYDTTLPSSNHLAGTKQDPPMASFFPGNLRFLILLSVSLISQQELLAT